MRVLVVLSAAIACMVAKPAAATYAYSAIAPLNSLYASAYNPLAYSGVPAPFLPYAAHAPFAYAAPVPVGIKSQYHAQDGIGQATYGHAEPSQVHHAVQDAAGNKVGSFSYVSPEGKFIQTNYVADAAGYRVASNDLPVAPVHNAVLPAPVADTPEVVAARAAHLAEVEKASRSKRSVTPAGTTPIAAVPALAPIAAAVPYAHPHGVYPYAAYPYGAPYPHAYPTSAVAPVTLPEGYNADTPEVVAAKANHFAEHAAAKARLYSGYPYVY